MIQLNFQKDRCKGCGFCIEFCPKKLLEFSQEMNNLGYHYAIVNDPEKCTGCAICASMCPEVVIEIKEV